MEQCVNTFNPEIEMSNTSDIVTKDAPGVHFLMETNDSTFSIETNERKEKDTNKDSTKVRTDLLEYMLRDNGSVICKLCGEVLQSRTHWYRHKYKVHVIHPLNPTPLFQCEQCLVYFKSRKGYIGHLASRHNELLSDSNPVLSNSKVVSIEKQKQAIPQTIITVKEEIDPELSIPKSSVPTRKYHTNIVIKPTPAKVTEARKPVRVKASEQTSSKADLEERRTREEKLVADIIDRVRRECEAQGTGGGTRRGYTRRTTVMNT